MVAIDLRGSAYIDAAWEGETRRERGPRSGRGLFQCTLAFSHCRAVSARRGAHRDATAVVRNRAAVATAAVAIAVLAIVNAMAVAIVETIAAAKPRDPKPPARKLNESRKSIAEPIKTRSN
jgi:hypothetical protein